MNVTNCHRVSTDMIESIVVDDSSLFPYYKTQITLTDGRERSVTLEGMDYKTLVGQIAHGVFYAYSMCEVDSNGLHFNCVSNPTADDILTQIFNA